MNVGDFLLGLVSGVTLMSLACSVVLLPSIRLQRYLHQRNKRNRADRDYRP